MERKYQEDFHAQTDTNRDFRNLNASIRLLLQDLDAFLQSERGTKADFEKAQNLKDRVEEF